MGKGPDHQVQTVKYDFETLVDSVKEDDLKGIYDAYIDNMRHESELIDHRINRLLGIQAFLITLLGILLLPPEDSSIAKVPPEMRSQALVCIYFLGTVSSLLTGVGVVAAKFAADFFQGRIDDLSVRLCAKQPESAAKFLVLPEIARYHDRGFRAGISWLLGRISDIFTPWLIFGGWIYLYDLLKIDYVGVPGWICPEGLEGVLDKCGRGLTQAASLSLYITGTRWLIATAGVFLLVWAFIYISEGRYNRWPGVTLLMQMRRGVKRFKSLFYANVAGAQETQTPAKPGTLDSTTRGVGAVQVQVPPVESQQPPSVSAPDDQAVNGTPTPDSREQ